MGHILNKTYTAPDGSVFCVEADGSVTKIKGGRVQSNEPPSKYQITPDGKIYRVESDGSVTYLGKAEDRQVPSPSHKKSTTEWSNAKWGCLIGILFLISIILEISVVFFSNPKTSSNNNSTTDSIGQSVMEQKTQNVEYDESQNEVYPEEVVPAVDSTALENNTIDSLFWPGDCQGEFYGTIGSLKIHGGWSCGSQMGGGWFYFDSQGEDAIRELSFMYDNPLIWYERMNDGSDTFDTGEWHFDYFNTTRDCIATGIYIRISDKQEFPFNLYKL